MAFEPIERFTLRSSLIKAFELATKASLPETGVLTGCAACLPPLIASI